MAAIFLGLNVLAKVLFLNPTSASPIYMWSGLGHNGAC